MDSVQYEVFYENYDIYLIDFEKYINCFFRLFFLVFEKLKDLYEYDDINYDYENCVISLILFKFDDENLKKLVDGDKIYFFDVLRK